MPQPILIIIICTALLGLILLWRGLHNIFAERLKRTRGLIQALFAFICFTTASILIILIMSLSAYSPYAVDKNIATITFEKENIPQTYTAFLDWDDGLSQRYTIKGEQWELSARIIKWNGFASNNLKLTPVYQFERFEGRYEDVDQEQYGEKTVYDLSRFNTINLWNLIKQNKDKLPFVDTEYGSATYLPIDTTKTYDVFLSSTGLYARSK